MRTERERIGAWPRWVGMVPYRTIVFLGLAVGMLGAGYIFAPQPGVAALPTASMPEAAPVASSMTSAAPAVRATTTQVSNRPPVPFVTRTPDKYYVAKDTDASIQAASGAGPDGDVSMVSLTVGGATDGGQPPGPGDARSGNSSSAKAAVERDGYKNVHALEKGPDGLWRGRAMRGSTEIAIRVDDSGNVSAE